MRESRKAAGLTQLEAARLLGVDKQTVSRWERGERSVRATDFTRALQLYEERANRRRATIDQDVSRETSQTARHAVSEAPAVRLPLDLEVMRAEFIASCKAKGANREEMDFVLSVLDNPAAQQFYAGGYRSAKSLEEAKLEMESVIDMLSGWLDDHLTMRMRGRRNEGAGD